VRVAAIQVLGNNSDERSTEQLLQLTRDGDSSVRATALQKLGQIGSERAQTALLAAARNGDTEDRIAAIGSLANLDDPRVGRELAQLMRDRDPQVARMAINASYNAGPEVDQVLVQIVRDPSAAEELKLVAAGQLRGRGADLDGATEQVITRLVGPAYGGAGYAGYVE